MSGIRIGRFGTTGLVDALLTWDMVGDTISITGWIQGSPLSSAQDLRAQIEGYVDSQDEPQVPVTWDEDSTVDGFYTVTGATVNVDAQGFAAGWYSFSATLVRTAAWSAPLVESRILGALRSALGPSAAAWHAVQGSATSYTASGATLTAGTRQTASGVVRLFTGGSNALLNARASWHVPPANWYDGAATLEVGPTDSASGGTVSFAATGGTRTWTVPAGVTAVTVDAFGAQGGGTGLPGGLGGRAKNDMTVAAGDVLTITVGMKPSGMTGGFGGGGNGTSNEVVAAFGGGGASRVVNGTGSVLMVVAGGGGGGYPYASDGLAPGGGGGLNGVAAVNSGNVGAGGGTQSTGGAGEIVGANTGGAGSSGVGGNGATASTASGGGGGYFGGGGGASGCGAGGSSYIPGTNATTTPAVNTGNGSVTITPITGHATQAVDYQTVVGRQIQPYPYGWRLSDGIISITPGYSGSALYLNCQWWTGSVWSRTKTFQVTDTTSQGSPAALSLVTVTALRNAPEETRVRLSLQYSGNVQTATVDLALRRGAPYVNGRITSTSSQQWGIACTTAEAGTSVTGGIAATASDADRNKYVLYSGTASTASTAQGGIYKTAAGTTMDFCLGASIGTSPAATDTPTALLNQYFAAATEQVNVVGR